MHHDLWATKSVSLPFHYNCIVAWTGVMVGVLVGLWPPRSPIWLRHHKWPTLYLLFVSQPYCWHLCTSFCTAIDYNENRCSKYIKPVWPLVDKLCVEREATQLQLFIRFITSLEIVPPLNMYALQCNFYKLIVFPKAQGAAAATWSSLSIRNWVRIVMSVSAELGYFNNALQFRNVPFYPQRNGCLASSVS